MNNLLLRTPKPFRDESYDGHLVRIAEANGLGKMFYLLKIAGISGQRKYERFNKNILQSIVTGHIFSEAMSHDYKSTRYHPINGHLIHKEYISKRVRVCIACIKKNGYASAFFDLSIVTACPIHSKQLLSRCPSCKQDLDYMRSRLLQCRCGADLSEATTENATPETLELLNVVLAVFNNSGLIASESMTGMPFDALTNMALNTLIALIRSTGASKRLVDQSRSPGLTINHNSEIAAAAAVFTNWPHHYHEFLGEHESYLLQRYTINNYDWPNSYEKLFNTPYPENEIKFLKKEYIEFIQKYWWLSQRAKKSAHVPRSYRHRYVATNIYAHLIGALPSTVKSMMIGDELLLISTLYQDIKSGERFKEIKNHQLPADCSQVLSS